MSDKEENQNSEKPEDVTGIRSGVGPETSGDFSEDDRSIIEKYADQEEADKAENIALGGGADPGKDMTGAHLSGEKKVGASNDLPTRVSPPVTSGDTDTGDDAGAGDDGFTSFDDVSSFDDEIDFSEEGYDFSEGVDDEDDGVNDIEEDKSFIGKAVADKGKKVKSAGVGNRFFAPMAVLIAAGAIGGYIVMNPDVIGGDNSGVSSHSVSAPVQLSSVSGEGVKDIGNGNRHGSSVSRENLDRPFDVAGTNGSDVTDESFPHDSPEYPVSTSGDIPRPPEMQAEPFSDDTEGGSVDVVDIDDVEVSPEAFDEPADISSLDTGSGQGAVADAGKNDTGIDIFETADAETSLLQKDIAEDVPVPEILAEQNDDVAQSVEKQPDEEIILASADIIKKDNFEGEESPAIPDEDLLLEESVEEALEDKQSSPYGEALVQDSSDNTSVGADAVRRARPATGKKKYFDAASQIPTSQMATDIGPRKVDPVLEPAQKYVIVTGAKKESDPEAMLVSANRALKLKRYDAAVEMFEQLYDHNNRDPRILMGLAVALQHAGRDESSLMVYDELLDIAPGNREAIVNMLGLLRKQYPSVAVRRLLDLQNEYPNDPMIAAQLGVTRADMRDYDEAEKYLGIAISLEPHNAQHYLNMAVVADRQGNKTNAVSYYEEALQVDAVYGNGRSIQREVIYDRLSVLRR